MNIDPEKFTELGIAAIKEMSEVARRNGQQEVEVWHLITALMSQENGIVPAIMEEMGIGTAPIQLALQRELKNLPKIAGNVNTARSYASAALTESVEKSQQLSKEMQDDYVSTEHLLLGLAQIKKPATFKQFLKNFEITEKKRFSKPSKGFAEVKKLLQKLLRIRFVHLRSMELILLNRQNQT